MPKLRKLPECRNCQFNARSQFIVCAIHPNGCKADQCIDFRLDNSIQIEPSWSPDGYEFYDGELISPASHLTQRDRLDLLETHPVLLGDILSAIASMWKLLLFIGIAIVVGGGMIRFDGVRSHIPIFKTFSSCECQSDNIKILAI